MAIAIKSIPVLKEDIAEKFEEKAQDTEEQFRSTVDFSFQIKVTHAILEKAQMN